MTEVPHINCTGYRIRKRNESCNSKFNDDMVSTISSIFDLIVDVLSVPLSTSDGGGYFLIIKSPDLRTYDINCDYGKVQNIPCTVTLQRSTAQCSSIRKY